MLQSVYLDYNASTPVDERVVARMLPFFTRHYGNPSNTSHPFGWAASEAVEEARASVAQCLGAKPSEIIFTGGATEAINTAIKGVARAYARKGNHIVTVATEHSAVLSACRVLQRDGASVTLLPVCPDGSLDLAKLEGALRPETILVSVMWANNETGVLHRMDEISRLVRSRGILLFSDATQAVGKVPVSTDDVDLLACSAHKAYGPKGVGALYVRSRVRMPPLIDGGGHERGRRSGTLNVPGIVGMGTAFALAQAELASDARRLANLRDRLEHTLLAHLPNIAINGKAAPRLPQTSSITFGGVRGSTLLSELRTVALSSGSACASESPEPSHVLIAMGLSLEQARNTVRISLGRPTTANEVDSATQSIIKAAQQEKAPIWT